VLGGNNTVKLDDSTIKDVLLSTYGEIKLKKVRNSQDYIKMAYNEIDKASDGVKLMSSLERNRMALKFLEMNSSPHKY
jgi:hypothetical protein